LWAKMRQRKKEKKAMAENEGQTRGGERGRRGMRNKGLGLKKTKTGSKRIVDHIFLSAFSIKRKKRISKKTQNDKRRIKRKEVGEKRLRGSEVLWVRVSSYAEFETES